MPKINSKYRIGCRKLRSEAFNLFCAITKIFSNVFALKIVNFCRNFEFLKIQRLGDKIHVTFDTDWNVLFLPSSRFCNFFIRRIFFFVNDGLSDFSIQSVHVNKPGQKGNPQKVPHSIKITKEQFRVMTAIQFRTTVRHF